MNATRRAVTDTIGQPILFLISAGEVSDYTAARPPVKSLLVADWLLGDLGYDVDWFREVLVEKGIAACFPGRHSRNEPLEHDKRRCKRRNRVEIMFGHLKDRPRIATRYDRCPKVFLSAIAFAAAHSFFRKLMSLETNSCSKAK